MEIQHALRILIPSFMVVAMMILSSVVGNVVHDNRSITASLMAFWIFGFLACWIILKFAK
jgi:hypothetical protein